MKAKHKCLGDIVKVKETRDFLKNVMYQITFPDGSKTTVSKARFEELFEVIK